MEGNFESAHFWKLASFQYFYVVGVFCRLYWKFILTRCVRRAHRWDTPGSFSMRQGKVMVNLHCGELHAEPCQYRAGNQTEMLVAVINRSVLSNELMKISVHWCPLRNENILLAFHCEVTTRVHMLMLATGGQFAYQNNSSEFLAKCQPVITTKNY